MFTLKRGDCLELMRGLPDKSVDLILCDLPYGTTACAWDSGYFQVAQDRIMEVAANDVAAESK